MRVGAIARDDRRILARSAASNDADVNSFFSVFARTRVARLGCTTIDVEKAAGRDTSLFFHLFPPVAVKDL